MKNSTRPFCALLAMMLAAEKDLEVDNNFDKTVPVPPIKEEDEPPSEPSQEDQDKSGSYRRSGTVTQREPYNLRPRGKGSTETELLVS